MRSVILLPIFLAVWITWWPAWGQAKDQTSPPKTPTDRKTTQTENPQRGSKESPIFIHIEQAPNTQTNPANTQSTATGKDFYDKLVAWATASAALFTFLLAIIGAGGICAALKTLKAIECQARIMQAQLDQTADVRWAIKGYPVNEICRIQAYVVNLSDRPMTIIDAQVAVHGQPAKSIPRNTVIDSNAPYPMNFEVPMGPIPLWEFVPTVRWSVTREHRITQKPVPRSLTGELHFWKGKDGQWGAFFDPSGGDYEADQKNNEQPN